MHQSAGGAKWYCSSLVSLWFYFSLSLSHIFITITIIIVTIIIITSSITTQQLKLLWRWYGCPKQFKIPECSDLAHNTNLFSLSQCRSLHSNRKTSSSLAYQLRIWKTQKWTSIHFKINHSSPFYECLMKSMLMISLLPIVAVLKFQPQATTVYRPKTAALT